ncbi:MAG: hypothetical protein QXZ66_09475 [Thermoproteota archaeon]
MMVDERVRNAQLWAAKMIELDMAREAREEKESVETVVRVSGEAEEGFFEAIVAGDQPAFLVYRDGEFMIFDKLHSAGVEILPPKPALCPYLPYEYAEDPIDQVELAKEIFKVFDEFIDIETHVKKRWSTEVVLSYLQHKVARVPYEYLLGLEESGKTQTLLIFAHLAYRPLFGTSIPAADIYSYLDKHPYSTILEDEIQGIARDPEKLKVYLSGYKTGARIPRTTVLPNGERRVDFFPCFGLKIVAARQSVDNPAFMERFIVTRMMTGYPVRDEFTPEDLDRFRNIRNRLLKLRLATMDQDLPEVDLGVKGRLKELWKPLFQVAAIIGFEEDLKTGLREHYLEYRRRREESVEAAIVKAWLRAAALRKTDTLSSEEVWSSLTTILEGQLDEKKGNLFHSSEYGDITKRLMGLRLSENLGAERVWKSGRDEGKTGSVRAWQIPPEKLARLARKLVCEHIEEIKPHEKRFRCIYAEKAEQGVACRNTICATEGQCRLVSIITDLMPESPLLREETI